MLKSEQEKKDFTSYALQKAYFYIESKFWSKLDIDTLNKWLHNFQSIDEKFCASKLLERFIYYSEEDILRLIKYGLTELIFKRQATQIELDRNFADSNQSFLDAQSSFFKSTLFLPLTSNNNPSESSGAIVRYLTNDIGIPEHQVIDINDCKKDLSLFTNLIILDDFVGSGRQIFDFWNYTTIMINKKSFIINTLPLFFPNLQIEYLCLVCTEEGYTDFHSRNTNVGLRITCCEKLTTKFKVFGSNSIYFDRNELDYGKDVLANLCRRSGISLLGYQGYDYAIAFHHSIPDTSLPLFFKEKDDWKPLFRNKKTNETNEL